MNFIELPHEILKIIRSYYIQMKVIPKIKLNDEIKKNNKEANEMNERFLMLLHISFINYDAWLDQRTCIENNVFFNHVYYRSSQFYEYYYNIIFNINSARDRYCNTRHNTCKYCYKKFKTCGYILSHQQRHCKTINSFIKNNKMIKVKNHD